MPQSSPPGRARGSLRTSGQRCEDATGYPLAGLALPAEDSPSGLGRTIGNRVGGNPSRVQIPHPPPVVLGGRVAMSCIPFSVVPLLPSATPKNARCPWQLRKNASSLSRRRSPSPGNAHPDGYERDQCGDPTTATRIRAARNLGRSNKAHAAGVHPKGSSPDRYSVWEAVGLRGRSLVTRTCSLLRLRSEPEE